VADFVGFIRREPVSVSCTRIKDSANGHLLAYGADRSMEEPRVMDITQK
jgi:hypothetical protein